MTLQGIVAEMSTDILTLQTRSERSVHVPVNANKYYASTQIQNYLVFAVREAVEYVQYRTDSFLLLKRKYVRRRQISDAL